MSASQITRRPSSAVAWFPVTPATESAVIDMASARQIAFRVRLRNHYWLTECRPISAVTIEQVRKKMRLIDQHDEMTEAEVAEVLTDHFGFVRVDEGWTIPELDEARDIAISAAAGRAARASAGGRAKAARRQGEQLAPSTSQPLDGDF